MNTDRRNFYQKIVLGLVLASGLETSYASYTNGDLFVNVIDDVTKYSYNLDLGISMETFLADNQQGISQTFSLPGMSSFFNGDTLEYNVVAYNLPANGANDPTDGFLVSSNSSGSIFANPTMTYTTFNIDQGLIQTRGNTLNTVGGSGAIITTTTALAAFNANGWGYGTSLSINISASAVYPNTATDTSGIAQGNQLFLNQVISPGLTGANGGTVTKFKGNTPIPISELAGYFSLSTTGLSWTSTVSTSGGTTSAVPLPAASWLFLGGLAGLLKLQKRKQA